MTNVDYKSLKEFLEEILEAKIEGSEEGSEEKSISQSVLKILGASLGSAKRAFESRLVPSGRDLAFDILLNVCIQLEVENLMNLNKDSISSTTDEFKFTPGFFFKTMEYMSKELDSSFDNNFSKVYNLLSPGIIWWIEKNFGVKVNPEEIKNFHI